MTHYSMSRETLSDDDDSGIFEIRETPAQVGRGQRHIEVGTAVRQRRGQSRGLRPTLIVVRREKTLYAVFSWILDPWSDGVIRVWI
jgi:hypothetical protein